MYQKIKLYNKNIILSLYDKKTNIMLIPKIIKITINTGFGNINNTTIIKQIIQDLSLITCQKPILTKSKKSISNFKIKKGYYIGCKITLRNILMYNFIIKLTSIIIPRIKNFNGFNSKSLDKYGNFTFGIKEQYIFPEITYEENKKNYGMNISIITNSNNKKDVIRMLKKYKFPLSN